MRKNTVAAWKEYLMSESNSTFDQIGKDHAALADAIVKNAWRIAGAMVVGMSIEIDGKRIPMEQQILKELKLEVDKAP